MVELRRKMWVFFRPIIGWLCIGLGIAGLVLPILQGWFFLMVGSAILGRRNRQLRWFAVHTKLVLRYWANLPIPMLSTPGKWALRVQKEFSCKRRRFAWWYMERTKKERGTPTQPDVPEIPEEI